MFERETRREKILEARNRELKLKEKAGTAHDTPEVRSRFHHQPTRITFLSIICAYDVVLFLFADKREQTRK